MLRFVHALLTVEGRYVLQLRDDKPGIAAPGCWSLFGGNVEDGEEGQAATHFAYDKLTALRVPASG